MAVFVETTTDAFQENLDNNREAERAGAGHNEVGAGNRIVRRPLRGLEIKEDTNAVLKVIQANGKELPLVDAGAFNASGRTNQYSNFILQSVQEARMEKHQIVETFGASYVFFFGEEPRFVDVSAIIINSHDFNWEAEWWENYENNFRGTKLVERGARLYLFYEDTILEGYMLQSQAVKSAQEPHMVNMNFRLFVTSYRSITFVGNPQFPIRASVAISEAADLRKPGSRHRQVSNLLGEARSAATDRNFEDAVALGIIEPRTTQGTRTNASSGDALIDDIINDPGGQEGRPGQAFDPESPPDFGGNKAERASSVSSKRRQLSREGQFGQKSSLSRFLRSVPASVSLPANIATSLELLGGGGAIADHLGNRPLRQVIAANADEYLGFAEVPSIGELQPSISPAQTQQEVDDLHLAAMAALACYGADVNDRNSILDIGLMPKFGDDANDPATFNPIPGVPFGIGLTEPDRTNSQLSAIRRDPLGVIFGNNNENTIATNRTQQGAGDKSYGYSSDYGRRPGVGRAGYGDNGGNGYGSGQGGGGDPGFKDPEKFSFLGVEGEAAAFSRFNKSRPNNTVFGESGARVSLGASNSGLSGGGATKIQGRPSPFTLASVKGTLKATAGASAFASASASAGANFNAEGVFVGASASASASAGFSLGIGGNKDNCSPQSPGIGLSLGAGVSIGI